MPKQNSTASSGKRHQRTVVGHARTRTARALRQGRAALARSLGERTVELRAAQEALREKEEELAAIYGKALPIMLLVDGKCRVRKGNRLAGTLGGTGAARLQGTGFGVVLGCIQGPKNAAGCCSGPICEACDLRQTIVDTLETGREHDGVEVAVPVSPEGERHSTFLVSTSRLWLRREPHVLVALQDITERKESERRIAQLNRAQAILAAVDHVILHVQERQQLLDEICRVTAEEGGFKLVWIGMVAADGSVRPVARAGETEFLEGLRVVVHDEPEGRGPVGTAIRENRAVVIEDVGRDPRMTPWLERAQRCGLHYVAAFPIEIAGKVAGSFQFYAPRAGFFDEQEIKLLTQVSDDISYALTALETIAERERAEQDLRKSEQELADFFAASPLAMLWAGPDGRILRVNEAELELLGQRSEDVLGRHIADFHVDREVAADVLGRVARKETVRNHRARVRDRHGSVKYVLIDANGLWERGQLVHSRWFVRDITHRVELEREILTISEREQRRLGHDLHDDLCQQLAGIEFLSQSLAGELGAKAAAEAGQAKEIAQSVQHAMAQTRELARGLSPVGMEAEGLMEGLREMAARTSKVFRLDCTFRCAGAVLVPDHAVAIHLYRIAQEAVGNAVKHGKARHIEIDLAAAEDHLRLGISDDGIGIPRKLKKSQGMGLRIMRYRAGVIGGSLDVRRGLRGGTTVVCTANDGLRPAQARSAK